MKTADKNRLYTISDDLKSAIIKAVFIPCVRIFPLNNEYRVHLYMLLYKKQISAVLKLLWCVF